MSEFRKPRFWVLFGFGLYWVFGFFNLNEQLGCLLADLAHQLSFLFRFASTLDYLEICKFITYWWLEAVNIKKSLIITGMTN